MKKIHYGTFTMEVMEGKRVYYFKGEFLSPEQIEANGYVVEPANVAGCVAIDVYKYE